MEKMSTLRSTLRELGFTSRPGHGNHEVWTDPAQPRRRVILYGKDSNESHKLQITQARDTKRTFKRGTMIYQH
jgi:hypothetical protein